MLGKLKEFKLHDEDIPTSFHTQLHKLVYSPNQYYLSSQAIPTLCFGHSSMPPFFVGCVKIIRIIDLAQKILSR